MKTRVLNMMNVNKYPLIWKKNPIYILMRFEMLMKGV